MNGRNVFFIVMPSQGLTKDLLMLLFEHGRLHARSTLKSPSCVSQSLRPEVDKRIGQTFVTPKYTLGVRDAFLSTPQGGRE